MITWWNELQLIQQIFAVIALPATVILLIQTVMLLFGLGGENDSSDASGDAAFDADADSGFELDVDSDVDSLDQDGSGNLEADAGVRIITIRGLVAFFAIGGWTGVALIDLGASDVIASLAALAAGFVALLMVAWIIWLLLRLSASGNVNIGNAIGQTGTVYLRIPGGFSGSGKVTITVQGRSREIDALTRYPEDLATGTQIQVTERRGSSVVVKPLYLNPKTKQN